MGCFGKLRHKRANNQTYNNTTSKSDTSGAKDGTKLVRNPPAEVQLAEKGRGASRTVSRGGGWSRNTRGGWGRSGGDWSGVGVGWGIGIGLSIAGGGCGGGACGGGGCGGGGC